MPRVIYSFPVTIIVLHKYRSKLLPGCSSSLERLPSNKDSLVKQLLNPLAWEQEQKHVWWQLITRVNICEDQVLSLVWGRCLVPLINSSVVVQRVDNGGGWRRRMSVRNFDQGLFSEEMTQNHMCETVQGMTTGRWGDIPAASSSVSDLISRADKKFLPVLQRRRNSLYWSKYFWSSFRKCFIVMQGGPRRDCFV